MQDTNGMTAAHTASAPIEADAGKQGDVVSTHVLVGEDQVEALRELSRRTRVAQSEYLREAVEDLLSKYRAVLEAKR
ncbi:MAG: ribbon-helix-helix domain-containing protein [Myxococcaceae bacterium]|nr:ribbon-helix-helix domain-containing protein [Myxococcaceae bacterium]